jgi:deazaflavin-dependent oxidoreductase (nitroreductase family)
MALKFKVDTSRHVADSIGKLFLSLHLAPQGNYLLTTVGRKTGIPHSTPVILIEEGEHRWLVAAFGLVGWVYNARVAGKVTLTRNGKSETLVVREVSAGEAVPVLRKYMANVAVTRPYFDVKVDSSDEAYLAEASRHPVFELSPV